MVRSSFRVSSPPYLRRRPTNPTNPQNQNRRQLIERPLSARRAETPVATGVSPWENPNPHYLRPAKATP